MIKRVISLVLLVSAVLSLSSCGYIISGFDTNLHGDIEEVDDEWEILYNGKKYSQNALLDVNIGRTAVEIGYKRSGLGSYSYYYNPDGSESPAYIVRTYEDYTAQAYIREDIDISSMEFEIGDSGQKIKFSEAFYDLEFRSERSYIGNYRVRLFSTQYPSLTLTADLRWSEGEWYMQGRYMLTRKFVDILEKNRFVPVNTLSSGDTTGLEGVNKYRTEYDYGFCDKLEGDICVFMFYMNDFESSWTESEIYDFLTDVAIPAFDFLEGEAEKYGVELDFHIQEGYQSLYYDNEIITDVKGAGEYMIDTIGIASRELGYDSTNDMARMLRNELWKKYGYRDIIFITVFNKQGNPSSYAAMANRYDDLIMTEHIVAFAGRDVNSSWSPINPTRFAMSVLYLYGAESMTASMWRWWMAKEYYPNDIMYSHYNEITKNEIGRASAFYIGWTDEAPRIIYNENW